MDTIRKALTVAERRILQQTLQQWRHKKVSWLMDTFGDIDHTLVCLGNMSERGQVVKFYKDGVFQGILAFDVGHVWWTPHRVCTELFVLAVAGNMFQESNALIGNGYKKHGYRQECSTYVKEVTE